MSPAIILTLKTLSFDWKVYLKKVLEETQAYQYSDTVLR